MKVFKQPMRTNFEDINVSQWGSVGDLMGFLAEMNLAEATYKSCEIPVPDHYDIKRQEIINTIKTVYRVETLKDILLLEQKERGMRTTEEQRQDTRDLISRLKSRLGMVNTVESVKAIGDSSNEETGE